MHFFSQIFDRRWPLRRWVLIVGVTIWTVVVGTGISALTRYEMTSGMPARALRGWPAQDRIALATDRATLVLFLHPYCACSRATLEELNRVLAQCPNRVTVHLVFFKPLQSTNDWLDTALWRSAQSIPGAAVIRDEESEGSLAHAFGAMTSGQVFLYSTRGTLLFSGGITGSRGHVGDNDGLDRLIASIREQSEPQNGGEKTAPTSPVFGCALAQTKDNSP